MSKILIADLLQGSTRLTNILAHGHELTFANTLERAMKAAIQEKFDLIIVGVLFDDSRMYELMSKRTRIGIFQLRSNCSLMVASAVSGGNRINGAK